MTTPETARTDPYRELFDRSADAILIIEGETFIDCNEAAVKMLRYADREGVLKTHPSELSPPLQPDGRDSFEKANEMIAIAFAEGSHRFEWAHRRADGDVFPVEVLLTAVQEADRHVLHVVWRDITERKALEERVRQTQKMEAIAELTGGLAHDFNNLLLVLTGHGELLEGLLQDRPDALEHVREIRTASARAGDLVRQLLAFGRRQQLLPSVLDVNQLVLDLHSLLQRVLGDGIELVTRLSHEPLTVRVDRAQLEQVLLELATNARDAMPEGGQLFLQTSLVGPLAPGGSEPQGSGPGNEAQITVSDTGSGMDAEVASRVFEPFFTTKREQHGRGMGLATVYGIVQQSGGTVTVESKLGEGATFLLHLPLTQEPLNSTWLAPEAAPVRIPRGGGETILVVEDEAAVSSLVVRALNARGFHVFVARDGSEALELYHKHGAEIDLVLTDVIMPVMGGPELARALEAEGFTPRMLFMSGYTDGRLDALLGDLEMLEKPFEVDELTRRVRAILDR